jgi:formylglycine-generating enzyme required for sulfatase activity
MVLIPAGSFLMGEAAGRADETPHTVALGAFWIDQTLVTQELYEQVMGVNPSRQKGMQNPVERVQWPDAARFCNKCSEREGRKPCYNLKTWECDFDADGYRLPTEAEWEYACRAGSTGKYCFGDDETMLPHFAWFKPLSQGKTRPVGQKLASHFGLYDIHGNVWEWCNDWYGEHYYEESPGEDPRGPAAGTQRVLRGGAWDCTAEKLRSAYRHKEFPVYSDACFGADSYGFRRVRKAVAVAPTITANPVAEPVSAPTAPVAAPAPAPRPAAGSGGIDLTGLKGTIVFVSDRGGTLKIWSMRASGTEAKQLTNGAEPNADPRFSRDGNEILYTVLSGGFPQIWRMNRDGSNRRFVTRGSQGSWAPDGQSIVFIEDNQAFVRELATGKQTRITPPEWERCGVPAFAPDGRRVAVASRHLGEIGIFIVGLYGRENQRLKTEEACCTPAWSRDGKRILCQTVQGHIHEVGVDGTNWEQLTYGADLQHDARYSPDGTLIVFSRAPAPEGPWQICLKKRDADSEEFVQLTHQGSNSQPDWTASED